MSINAIGRNLLPVPIGDKSANATKKPTLQSEQQQSNTKAVVNYSPQVADEFDSARSTSRTQYDSPNGSSSNAIFAYKQVLHMDKAEEIQQMLGVDIYA